MKHYNLFKQENFAEILDLIESQSTCLLQTLSVTQEIQVGLFNPLQLNGRIYFHLHRGDEQLSTIRHNPVCQLLFQDVLALLPSHWVDDRYAGAATTFYRYAQLNCQCKIIEDPGEQSRFLQAFMARYQPEGGYQPISGESMVYKGSLKTIAILECEITEYTGKWKLGQNHSLERRHRLIERFRERAEGNDRRCAYEIEKWITAHSVD